jgi:hypothetical protein
MILAPATARLLRTAGSQLPLIAKAAVSCRPALFAIAVIVTVMRAWLASVPSRQRIGRPDVQPPRLAWIETTLSGSREPISKRTSDAACGPRLVT